MDASSIAYRLGKRAIGAVPAGWLRVRPFSIYEMRVAERAPPPPADAEGPRVAWAGGRDQVTELRHLSTTESRDAWDGASRRVAVAWRDGEPIGCAWIATGAYDEPGLAIRYELAPEEAWLYAATVAPEHRQRGVYRRLVGFVLEELAREGAGRLLMGVSIGNEPSRRAHTNQGARPIGSVYAASVFGKSLCVCRGGVRRAGALPVRLRFGARG